jgi:membrane-bound lytic murein transglycosylase F
MKLSDRLLITLMFVLSTLIIFKLVASSVPDVRKSKELVVVTSNGPNTYFIEGQGKHAGFENDLAWAFADYLGPEYRVRLVIKDTLAEVIPTLLNGEAHFAAANLSVTPERETRVKFGMPYLDVQQHVVYNPERNPAPESLESLYGKLVEVPYASSYDERLHQLSEQYPKLKWLSNHDTNTEELAERLCFGTLDYTIADNLMLSILQNYYPCLSEGIAVGNPEKLAWAFPKDGDPWLYEQSVKFFSHIKSNGELKKLIDRYYGHIERLNPADVTRFLAMMRTDLPRYTSLFKQAQELTGIDWRLLAALSYQESHWEHKNTSPTNVRGLMMLTEETADSLGVTDRLDPKQSVMGGAQYLLQLKNKLPERIGEPDRTWMSLAAYNIGLSHLEDARVLASRLGRNPDNWADIKATLPLLNKPQYYSKLRFGYASGGAPVIFVESIRTYFNILARYTPEYNSRLPFLWLPNE